MSDLISRQAALDAFGLSEKTRKYGGDHSGYDTRMLYEIQDTLESLPTVQQEIIRCKDCKYMIDTGDDLMCDNAKGWVVATTSDFGCVLAERRTDG